MVATNPFAGTPLASLILEMQTKKGEKFLSFTNVPKVLGKDGKELRYINEDDYKNYGDDYLNTTMFNPRQPLTYLDIRDLHSKHYGNQATLTIESGRMVKPDFVFGGTGRSELATPGGATSEEMMFSEKYMVPSTVKYKKEKTNVEYTPVKGMTETTTVLLGGTSMGTVEQIESTLEDFAGDVVGLEGYVTNLLLEQQQSGLLPKALTVTDMEMLKDSILDDIFEMEYEIKTDKTEVTSSVDNEEIIPLDTEVTSVEDTIIKDTVENFPVDTEIETTKTEAQIEREKKLKKEQIERQKKIDNIVNKATTVVDSAQDFLEKSKNKTREEKIQLRDEREKKVIDFFKKLIPGGE